MGDYEAPSGWEEVEMNETNVTQLQTRSTFYEYDIDYSQADRLG